MSQKQLSTPDIDIIDGIIFKSFETPDWLSKIEPIQIANTSHLSKNTTRTRKKRSASSKSTSMGCGAIITAAGVCKQQNEPSIINNNVPCRTLKVSPPMLSVPSSFSDIDSALCMHSTDLQHVQDDLPPCLVDESCLQKDVALLDEYEQGDLPCLFNESCVRNDTGATECDSTGDEFNNSNESKTSDAMPLEDIKVRLASNAQCDADSMKTCKDDSSKHGDILSDDRRERKRKIPSFYRDFFHVLKIPRKSAHTSGEVKRLSESNVNEEDVMHNYRRSSASKLENSTLVDEIEANINSTSLMKQLPRIESQIESMSSKELAKTEDNNHPVINLSQSVLSGNADCSQSRILGRVISEPFPASSLNKKVQSSETKVNYGSFSVANAIKGLRLPKVKVLLCRDKMNALNVEPNIRNFCLTQPLLQSAGLADADNTKRSLHKKVVMHNLVGLSMTAMGQSSLKKKKTCAENEIKKPRRSKAVSKSGNRQDCKAEPQFAISSEASSNENHLKVCNNDRLFMDGIDEPFVLDVASFETIVANGEGLMNNVNLLESPLLSESENEASSIATSNNATTLHHVGVSTAALASHKEPNNNLLMQADISETSATLTHTHRSVQVNFRSKKKMSFKQSKRREAWSPTTIDKCVEEFIESSVKANTLKEVTLDCATQTSDVVFYALSYIQDGM